MGSSTGSGVKQRDRAVFLMRAIVMFLAILVVSGSANAGFARPAVVKTGAFLLSAKPETPWKGRQVHRLISYLPTGTIVFFDPDTVNKKNYRTGIEEPYFRVLTNAGNQGLLRRDLLQPLPSRPVIVAAADVNLPIMRKRGDKKLATFSRTKGVYLEILPERDGATYYAVRLPWTKRIEDGRTVWDEGRFDKDFVKQGDGILFTPQRIQEIKAGLPHFAFRAPNRKHDAPATRMGKQVYGWLLKKMSGVIGVKKDEISTYLKTVVLSPCATKVTSQLKLNAAIAGSGLLISAFLNVKEKGYVYRMETISARNWESAQRTDFVIFRRIRCAGLRPSRLQNFLIEGPTIPDQEGLAIAIADLPKRMTQRWDPTLKSKAMRSRMVVVRGYEDFKAVYDYLREQMQAGSYLGQFTEGQRHAFTMFLIKQIAYFANAPSIGAPPPGAPNLF